MEDLLTGEKRKYFDPRLYINTLSGFLLAFIKMIESAAAAAGLILVLHRARLGALSLQELLAPLQQLSNLVPAVDLSWLPLIPLRYQLAITFVILVLTILDGVGLLLIRTGASGGGLVRFVHTVLWIGHILMIIGVIFWTVRVAGGFGSAGRALRGQSSDAAAAFGLLGMSTYLYGIAAVLGLLYYGNYHHDIRVVLKTVEQEHRTREAAAVGRNHLYGRSFWMMLGSVLYAAVSILLLIGLLSADAKGSAESAAVIRSVMYVTVFLAANALYAVLEFLKYAALCRCMRNFRKVHR